MLCGSGGTGEEIGQGQSDTGGRGAGAGNHQFRVYVAKQHIFRNRNMPNGSAAHGNREKE